MPARGVRRPEVARAPGRRQQPAAGEAFESPLQGLPNVILTPHVGGSTAEAQENIGQFVAGKLLDYTENGSTELSVNFPEVTLTRVSTGVPSASAAGSP